MSDISFLLTKQPFKVKISIALRKVYIFICINHKVGQFELVIAQNCLSTSVVSFILCTLRLEFNLFIIYYNLMESIHNNKTSINSHLDNL